MKKIRLKIYSFAMVLSLIIGAILMYIRLGYVPMEVLIMPIGMVLLLFTAEILFNFLDWWIEL